MKFTDLFIVYFFAMLAISAMFTVILAVGKFLVGAYYGLIPLGLIVLAAVFAWVDSCEASR
ncbi:hypothetical protein B0181_08325 [Moraxella caviae]|uniref:Uncharacterized protein n=1 Tax=Moraxella caviae TaxID=34060 RepID=A0A1S9ZYA4_9GAMM|nr:hypothetical protein [Moraxella caviae]OOR88388.1 hypothetical protein B0181_08325 [Moraxella caviae]STZ14501.1 Uncharacterised protein [Moraxella caviae]VEW11319.1 Uncharacterised protein [Moraxella caviae]